MDGCEILWLSMCSFAATYRKGTRLGLVRAPFLRPLAKPCAGFRSHVRLSGALCSQAARYPDGFAREYAACAYAAFVEEAPALGQVDIERARADASGGFELVWFNEVMRSSDWSVFMNEPVKTQRHINILEVRAAGQAARLRAAECPSTKQLYPMDSRVGVGCLAKGRSASKLLSDSA